MEKQISPYLLSKPSTPTSVLQKMIKKRRFEEGEQPNEGDVHTLLLNTFTIVNPENYAAGISSFTSGYGTQGSACLELQSGFSGEIEFAFTVTGILASDIQDVSSKLEASMTADQKSSYQHTTQNYGGGLNIPVLSWIGINLGASYSKETIDTVSAQNSKYAEQSSIVAQHIVSKSEYKILMKGKITGYGNSEVPKRGCAYVQLATVKLYNGQSKTVFGSSPESIAVVDPNNHRMPSDNGQVTTIPL